MYNFGFTLDQKWLDSWQNAQNQANAGQQGPAASTAQTATATPAPTGDSSSMLGPTFTTSPAEVAGQSSIGGAAAASETTPQFSQADWAKIFQEEAQKAGTSTGNWWRENVDSPLPTGSDLGPSVNPYDTDTQRGIEDAYERILGRQVGQPGRDHYGDLIDDGKISMEDLPHYLLDSDEFKYGDLNQMYNYFLGRDAGIEGAEHYGGLLSSGERDNQWVAETLFNSTEGRKYRARLAEEEAAKAAADEAAARREQDPNAHRESLRADRDRLEAELSKRHNEMFAEQEEALTASLRAQGIQPGTEAYRRAMRDFNERRDRMGLEAMLAAGQEQSRQVGLGLNLADWNRRGAWTDFSLGNQAQAQDFYQQMELARMMNQQRDSAINESVGLDNSLLQQILAILGGTTMPGMGFASTPGVSVPGIGGISGSLTADADALAKNEALAKFFSEGLDDILGGNKDKKKEGEKKEGS